MQYMLIFEPSSSHLFIKTNSFNFNIFMIEILLEFNPIIIRKGFLTEAIKS